MTGWQLPDEVINLMVEQVWKNVMIMLAQSVAQNLHQETVMNDRPYHNQDLEDFAWSIGEPSGTPRLPICQRGEYFCSQSIPTC